MQDIKTKIVQQCLKKLDQSNWSAKLVIDAIKELDINENYFEILFKSDVNNVINHYIASIDQKMLNEINNNDDYEKLPVSQKIFTALKVRLEIVSKDKNIIKKNTIYYSSPNNYLKASKAAWNTADLIWKLAGDKSTDFNYYSKRSILSSLYSTAILYWLKEKDEDISSTLDYINRALKRVALIGKIKSKVKFKNLAIVN